MPKKNPQFDSYIERAQPFAQPILKHFRKLVHATCPECVEKIKWGFTHFDYKDAPLCHMAAFKQHCAIGFWKGKLLKKLKDPGTGMGNFGRITSKSEMPTDKLLVTLLREAMALNDAGVKVSKPKPKAKVAKKAPADLGSALKKDRKAAAGFAALTTAQRNEYIEWLLEAKTQATRDRRLATILEWVADGKSINWKYKK